MCTELQSYSAAWYFSEMRPALRLPWCMVSEHATGAVVSTGRCHLQNSPKNNDFSCTKDSQTFNIKMVESKWKTIFCDLTLSDFMEIS